MKPSSLSYAHFSGRLALQQRVLPLYRRPFVDALASACQDGLSIFAGKSLPGEGIVTTTGLETADFVPARNWHFANPSSPFYLCWQWGLLRWLRDWNPDALIVEANPRYLSTRLAVMWMHARGRIVLGWGLGAPPLSGILAPLRRNSRLTFLRSLDGVVAYSQKGAQEYRTLGLSPERIFVAVNASMPKPTSPPPERLPHFRGRPIVLFVGRLQARKRIDILLRACAALPDDLQPRLIIVGDGPARHEFETLAEEVYPSAEFVGAKYGDEVASYFAAADLFALPGTGGLAVQQAMSYGLPVIVAQGDGTQDNLVRPENGWQVPPGDQAAFSQTLRQALSDVSRLRHMGAESYRIVTKEVNVESMVADFVKALHVLEDSK